MIVKNEYVEIKKGNKTYTKQNMILNSYLKTFMQKQLVQDSGLRYITYCYLKLDTPLENIDYDTTLLANSFDIKIPQSIKPTISATNKNIKINYNFDDSSYNYKKSDNSWEYVTGSNFNIFTGRKIVGIGFGTALSAYAYLDTRNMNIIINTNEQFRITRVDNIISDGIASHIEYPLHLVNDLVDRDAEIKIINVDSREITVKEITKAQLYSIGFGNTQGYMEEEYLIGDVETDRDDYSITFDVSRTKKVGHYPSEDLHFPFYPTMDNSKYLIFKYRLYRIYFNSFTEQDVITNLDEYYTMSKPNENFGNLEIKLKIERS